MYCFLVAFLISVSQRSVRWSQDVSHDSVALPE
jgi:hypothetical protein